MQMKFLRYFILFSGFFLAGCSRPATLDLQKFTPPDMPNHYLVCPAHYCAVIPNEYSPVYPVSAEDLFAAWSLVMAKTQRVNFISVVPEQGQYQMVYHSWLLNLPDDITVQFIALPNNGSTIAIYAQSRYLPFDFLFNQRQVKQWLKELNQAVATLVPQTAEEKAAASAPAE